jgi:hypothetical protein
VPASAYVCVQARMREEDENMRACKCKRKMVSRCTCKRKMASKSVAHHVSSVAHLTQLAHP